jgi:hypothetical protein
MSTTVKACGIELKTVQTIWQEMRNDGWCCTAKKEKG